MSISKLSHDCLTLIIEESYYDDKNSLLSCLLVSKIWCKTVAPILWRDPWKFLIDNEKVLDGADKFFNIILSHLSEESRNYLKGQRINISLRKGLLFNYIQFIRRIRHNFGPKNQLNIYKKIYKEIYDPVKRNILKQEIYKLFISKSTSITFLDFINVEQPIYQFPGAETSLSNLDELYCYSLDDASLFFGLAQICRMIEKFYFASPIVFNPGLSKLIEMQRKIKYLKITSCFDSFKEFCKQVIMKRAHQFLYLELIIIVIGNKDLNFLNNLLSKSINLQKLILNIKHNHLDLTMYISFNHYQDHSESLQMIWEEFMHYLGFDIPKQLNEMHYLKIKYIKIAVTRQYLEKFERILINCQNLEGLIIDHKSYYSLDMAYYYDSLDMILDILSKSSSINVYKIQILECCHFHRHHLLIERLRTFFSKWRGRKPMMLYLHNNKKCASLASLIEKYVKEGVINMYVNTHECIFDGFGLF